MSFTKTPCPISRAAFSQGAKPLTVVIDGKTCVLDPKNFSTGSLGWNLNDKIDVMVGGVKCRAQVGLNITLANSKELPKDTATAAA